MSTDADTPLFTTPVSCSNLVKPEFERFMAYSRTFFDARWYTNDGPLARELEQRLAGVHQVAHCVCFSSGFWALVLSIKALALPGREEVVMPSLTYRRLADAVGWTGLVPRFCEVDGETMAISAETAASCMGQRTALLLAVHPMVNCCEVDAIEELARARRVPLLVDAVESCYETYAGRKVGEFGNAEVFSLHASKLLNGFEGGYATTNDAELAARLQSMRGFGFSGQDNVVGFGMNAKLNEIHAAMALASLDDVEDQIPRNRERYRAYQTQLADMPGIELLEFDEREQTSFKNIVVELTDAWPLERDMTVSLLNAQGILARAYYSPPLHQKPYAYDVRGGELPSTDALARRCVMLPCGARVDVDDIAKITGLLRTLGQVASAEGAVR